MTLFKRLMLHVTMGAAVGYVILHPASVVIFDWATMHYDSLTASVASAFFPNHRAMALYFSLIGSLSGLLNGVYTHRTARLNERLKKLSFTDELTALYNRRFFIQSLTRELRRAQRYGNPLSLIMIDIDHFKQFNDTYGHLAGDRLLAGFAERLRKTARGTDVVTRYGGEEFAVLMPDTGIHMAARLAERIRQDIERRTGAESEQAPTSRVTVSIGCAQVHDMREPNVDDFIKKADDCLYKAKNQGRNRILC